MPPFARRVQPAAAPAGEPVQPSRNTTPAFSSRGPFRIPHGWWVIIAIVYILSPIDLIPELVLGPLGIVDDAGMLAFGAYSARRWWQSRVSSKR